MTNGKRTGFKGTTHPCYNTRTWKRLRLRKLAFNPVCEICERRGRAVPANGVDHIKALSDGGEWYPRLDQLMSLCHRCHALKTARYDHGSAQADDTRNRFAGTDTSGNPLDPFDPWNDGEGGINSLE